MKRAEMRRIRRALQMKHELGAIRTSLARLEVNLRKLDVIAAELEDGIVAYVGVYKKGDSSLQ